MRLIGATGFVLLALMAGAEAQAQPAGEPAAKAAEHKRNGKRLYDLGKFAEAVAEFEEAYKLGEDPPLLFNLAQAYRRMNQNAKAAELYESYLRQVPDAPNRAEIEERIIALKKTLGPPDHLMAPAAAPVSPSSGVPPVASGAPPVAAVPGDAAGRPAPTPVAAGERRHDRGFLRVLLGPGALSARSDKENLEISGGGGTLAVAAGAALRENVIVYAELIGSAMSKPEAKVNGISLGTAQNQIDNATALGLGAGAAYYFMPVNLYLSGALYAAVMTRKLRPDLMLRDESSDTGGGFSLAVGKEWWVGPQLGVGVAGMVSGCSAKFDSGRWNFTAVSLVFSATYN